MSDYIIFLKTYRRYFCLSQQDLADRMQVSVSIVKSWESGRRAPGRKFFTYFNHFFMYCDFSNYDQQLVVKLRSMYYSLDVV